LLLILVVLAVPTGDPCSEADLLLEDGIGNCNVGLEMEAVAPGCQRLDEAVGVCAEDQEH
jgi:hypothetical protein